MSDVAVSIEIDASPAAVWAAVEPIERHVDWMADAASISFDGDQTRGVGTRFVCVTRIGPIRLADRMEITEWVPVTGGATTGRMGVRHEGVVRGSGVFTIGPADTPERTAFGWSEDLTFPWWMGGRLGAWFAGRFVLGPIWRRNLRTLRSIAERRDPPLR